MSAFIAIIPIVLLFILMLGLKISGHKSAFYYVARYHCNSIIHRACYGFVPESFTLIGVSWAVVEDVLKAVFLILIIISIGGLMVLLAV